MNLSEVETASNPYVFQQEKQILQDPYIYDSKERNSPSNFQLDEREVPILNKLVSSLPLLSAYPIIFLSHELSLQNRGDFNNLPNSILLNIFMSATFMAILVLTNWLTLIPINNVSDIPREGVRHKISNTIYLLISSSIVLVPIAFIPAGRLAVLLLALFQNPWNFYTPISFIFDFYTSWNDSWISLVPIICSYSLVLIGFILIYRKLRRTAISTVLSNMEISIILGVMIISGMGLLLFNPDQLSYSMMGMNVATIFVTIISLSQFQMRDNVIAPIFVSIFSTILELIIIGMSISTIQVFNVILTFLIKPDSSRQWTSVKASTKPRSPILKELIGHSDTRAIFNFLLLNASFMFVQFLYSFRSKSLGLLSDSLHMALDCMSLAIGLVAGVISKHEIDPNGKYPFGLRNFEILAGFTNGSLLVGISATIMFEAIGRLLHPVHLQKTNELIVVSIMGLLVNLVGIFAFNHGHAHGHSHTHGSVEHGYSHGDSHGHSHEHSHEHLHENSHEHSHGNSHSNDDQDNHMNDNMRGIFLHILADALGSVGVVISTILTKLFDWQGFDPISSIIIATAIFVSAVPLIKSTASTLLLQIATRREDKIRNVLHEISEIRGVRSFTSPRFWPNSSNSISGYIHIQIYRGENGSYIKKQCEKIFENTDIDVMIQIENDYDDCWCRK